MSEENAASILKRVKMEATGFFLLPNYKASHFRRQQYCVYTAVRISTLTFATLFTRDRQGSLSPASVKCRENSLNGSRDTLHVETDRQTDRHMAKLLGSCFESSSGEATKWLIVLSYEGRTGTKNLRAYCVCLQIPAFQVENYFTS